MFVVERKEAIRAVVRACRLCVDVQSKMVSEDSIAKKDRSPVTVADYGAQAIIINHLTTLFPTLPFIAEENSKQLQQNETLRSSVYTNVLSHLPVLAGKPQPEGEQQVLNIIDQGANKSVDGTGRWWTLDPIDGTQGFLRKGQYAVALALMENNEPVVGVLGCPELPHNMSNPDGPKGQVLVAVRGQGAQVFAYDDLLKQIDADEFTGGVALNTSSVVDASKAEMTESFEQRGSAQSLNSIIANELGVSVPPVRVDSQCKYAIVARGESSVYLRLSSLTYQEKIWDHAAGVIIVEEAGGKVTDFRGNKLNFAVGHTLNKNTGIVCTNGKLHDTVMQAINKVDAIGHLETQSKI